jgi:hypothetical protein
MRSLLRTEQALDKDGEAFQVVVPFTSLAATQAALDEAGFFARNLNVRIRVVAVQLVPFGVPMECPPVSVAFLEGALSVLSSAQPLEREIYLTRDLDQTWTEVLSPGSLVLMPPSRQLRKSQWRDLARALTRRGHDVCFVSGT